MKCYVINLARAKRRWQSISAQLNDLGVVFERVEAADGPKGFKGKLDTSSFGRNLSNSEIGCYLSHIYCWKRLVSSSEEFAVIMEDDAVLSRRIVPFVLNGEWIPPKVDLIQLFSWTKNVQLVKVLPEKKSVRDGELIRQIKPTPMGLLVYVISRRAAAYAIESSRDKICAPVDEALFNPQFPYAKKFPVWKLNPSVAYPEGVESFINDGRTILENNKEKTISYFVNKYKLSLYRAICGRCYSIYFK